jgi:hypothetical protein
VTVLAKIRGLFRRRPLAEDQLRALGEAEFAQDHLRSLKSASRSLGAGGSQQIAAGRRDARF